MYLSLIRSKCCERLRCGLHSRAVFFNRETAKIDAVIAKVRDAINKLKEYRTALISAR